MLTKLAQSILVSQEISFKQKRKAFRSIFTWDFSQIMFYVCKKRVTRFFTSEMIENSRTLRIPLFGGLGNQLFQLSFALQQENRFKQVILDVSNLSSRQQAELNESNLIELLPAKFKLQNIKNPYIVRKIINLALRASTQENPVKFRKYLKSFIKLLLNAYFSARYLNIYNTYISNGIGFPAEDISDRRDLLAIGYFQTYVYADSSPANQILKRLKTEETLNEVHRTVGVQLRLGDYLNDPNFGLLNENYYRTTLNSLLSKVPDIKVVIFTNDPVTGLKLLS